MPNKWARPYGDHARKATGPTDALSVMLHSLARRVREHYPSLEKPDVDYLTGDDNLPAAWQHLCQELRETGYELVVNPPVTNFGNQSVAARAIALFEIQRATRLANGITRVIVNGDGTVVIENASHESP